MALETRTFQVTFDAHDPRALSTFWRDVLGYVHPGPPGVEVPEGTDPLDAWDPFLEQVGVPADQRNNASAIEDPAGAGPRVFFQRVPEPKTAKNRVHLDVTTSHLDGLVAAGARVLLPQADGRGWTVLADPGGNEFCAFVAD